MKNLTIQSYSIIIGLFFICLSGCISFSTEKTLPEKIAESIKTNPDDWTEITTGNEDRWILDTLCIENKKCNIKIIRTNIYSSSFTIIKPDTVDLTNEEGVLIYIAFEEVKEQKRLKKQEEIAKNLCK